MSQNVNALTQNECIAALNIAIKADTPIMLTGAAGIGKSAIVHAVAKANNLRLIDIRLSQVTQYDLLGFPVAEGDRMVYKPMQGFPLENDSLFDEKTNHTYDGFLLFLDELNSADKYTQGAAYRLLLDREIGQHKLHEKCVIIGAGNRATDQALVNKLLSPVKSRMTHIEMTLDTKQFIEYVAEETQKGVWHPYILGYLNFNKRYVHNFDPKNEKDVTFACPRTWHLLSKQLNAGLLTLPANTVECIAAGIVGMEAAVDFCAFVRFIDKLPRIEEIMQDPMNAPLPEEIGAKWALGAFLYDKVNKGNAQQVAQYVSRVPEKDIEVVIYRSILPKYPAIASISTVQEALKGIRNRINNVLVS